MRSFIISLVLIFLLVSLSVVNDIYISSVTDELIDMTEKLPGGFPSTRELEAIGGKWGKNLPIISLTVNQKYISAVSLALINLKASASAREEFDYQSSRSALSEALLLLKSTQCLSLPSLI